MSFLRRVGSIARFLLGNRRQRREYFTLCNSWLFEADWYRKKYPQAAAPEIDPIVHYLTHGAKAGCDPGPLFDTAWYMDQYPDIARDRFNPLFHYVRYGIREKRNPNPWFDAEWYTAQDPEPDESMADPLLHYVRDGWKSGRDPGPFFDTAWYLAGSPAGERVGRDPLTHFIEAGATDGRLPAEPQRELRRRYFRIGAVGSRIPRRTWTWEQGSRFAQTRDARRTVMLIGHWLGELRFGAERSITSIIRSIDKKKFRIVFVCPREHREYFEEIRDEVAGIVWFHYTWWTGEAEFDEGIVAQFGDLYREFSVDLVHANTVTMLHAVAAARKTGIPSILHVRELLAADAPLSSEFSRPATQVLESARATADYILANSETTLSWYDRGDGRSSYLYNSVDPELFLRPNRIDGEVLKVGLISSNIPKKGVEDVVDLARCLAEQSSRVQFLLIGPETELTRDIRRSQDDGVAPANILFPGYTQTPRQAIDQVNVVLCLSHVQESFGRTVAEAMAAGRPVVVYDHGALPELVRHEMDGYVVSFRDTRGAAAALDRLVQDHGLVMKLGENGRQRARELFDKSAGAARLNQLYDSLVEGMSDPVAARR